VALGKRGSVQGEFWVSAENLPKSPGHPFYKKLNQLLAEAGFDDWVEERCEEFYAGDKGRPGIPPGVYFRMLLVGYFEGITSQRGIAWRSSDSLSLRSFLGLAADQDSPDHSSLTRVRKRLPLEVHEEIFEFVLHKGYHKAKTLADLDALGVRTYIPEPQRKGQRKGKGKPAAHKAAVHGNRRRVRGERSRRLGRKRSELAERSFAHMCETGDGRRTWLRGLVDVTKRYVIQGAARNLGVILRKLFGMGTPRGLQRGLDGLVDQLLAGESACIAIRLRVMLRMAKTNSAIEPSWIIVDAA
jgi:hypothetical protein